MSWSPTPQAYAGPPFVSFASHGPAQGSRALAVPASGTYPAADRALYLPIDIPKPTVVYRFFWLNGATASTNNIQVGIYNADFTSFLLGTSTLASGADVCQFDNVTDTPIPAGHYWLAIWCNGTTTTLFRTAVTRYARPNMMDEDSLTGGLPSTATPTAAGASFIPVFGFTTIASP